MPAVCLPKREQATPTNSLLLRLSPRRPLVRIRLQVRQPRLRSPPIHTRYSHASNMKDSMADPHFTSQLPPRPPTATRRPSHPSKPSSPSPSKAWPTRTKNSSAACPPPDTPAAAAAASAPATSAKRITTAASTPSVAERAAFGLRFDDPSLLALILAPLLARSNSGCAASWAYL